MKKICTSLLVAAICAAPALAQATTPYFSASAGSGSMNKSSVDGENNVIEYNSGTAFNGSVGLEVKKNTRVEFAVGHQTNDVDNIYGVSPSHYGINMSFSIWSFMANGYVDLPTKNAGITPYLMAGMGLADVNTKFSDDVVSGYSVTYSDTVFAWQIGGGVGIKASDKVIVDLGYRYLSPSDVTVLDMKHSLSSSNLLAGIRYSF
jgi:opacity protein-like surface antigen